MCRPFTRPRNCQWPTPYWCRGAGPHARAGQEDERGDLRPGLQRRQKKDETIGSQTAALREHAAQARLDVPEDWVFDRSGPFGCDAGPPGPGGAAGPGGPGLRGRGAGVLAGPAGPQVPQALLLEEFARAGVRAEFVKGPRGDSPEDQLLVQLPGHVRRVRESAAGRAVPAPARTRARTGSVNVLSARRSATGSVPQDRPGRGCLPDRRGPGGAGGGDVPPLRRRRAPPSPTWPAG